MKKLFVLLVGVVMMLFTQQVFPQLRLTENFSVVPPANWAASSAYWRAESSIFLTGTQSCRGTVPPTTGTQTILETQGYNFSAYQYVLLRFNHICKISPSDTVWIECGYHQGGGVYGNWKPLPANVYKGGAANYGSRGFNAASYPVWNAANNLEKPTTSWFKTEEFDLEKTAGQQQVKFRFVIKHGSVAGTHAAYGWLIDEFEILASSNPIIPPTVEFLSPFVRDTVYSTGPWEINAKVKSNTSVPIAVPILEWSIDNWQTISSIPMTMVKGDSLWKAEIPQYQAGTNVVYRITGKDITPNTFNTATISSKYYIKMSCGSSGWAYKEYFYTGNFEQLLLQPGVYELECWGANGGNCIGTPAQQPGGKGGYAKGQFTLNNAQMVYVCVGGKGVMSGAESYGGGGGGGGTDIRTLGELSLAGAQSRIIVAGGGGGAGSRPHVSNYGGNGGGQGGGGGISPAGLDGDNTKGGDGGTGSGDGSGGGGGGYGGGGGGGRSAGSQGLGGVAGAGGGVGGVSNGCTSGGGGLLGGGGGSSGGTGGTAGSNNGGGDGGATSAGTGGNVNSTPGIYRGNGTIGGTGSGGWNGGAGAGTYGGGGGGGWYGGGGGNYGNGGGGGGSSYVTLLNNGFAVRADQSGFVVNPDASGNGYAKITFIASLSNCDTSSAALHSISIKDTTPTSLTYFTPITVTIKNKGVGDLDSVRVSYTVNGLNQKDSTIKFAPNPLQWDMSKQVTIGTHNFTPNSTDILKVWVSYPNGKLDNERSDDTITKKIYGAKDITVQWADIPEDTVHYTGHHEISAKIVSLSGVAINNVKLYVKTTGATVSTDSFPMSLQGGDLWAVSLPQMRYETKVAYWIQFVDFMGNTVRLDSNYYIKKECGYTSGGSSGGQVGVPQDYTYKGSAEPVTLAKGTYQIECWGASGGAASIATTGGAFGGKGGYSKGTITPSSPTTVYVSVGGTGVTGPVGTGTVSVGGWNGGGNGGGGQSAGSGSGGGATHVATASGLLSSLSSNQSAVKIVAGGGGGGGSRASSQTTPTYGGDGGGITGMDAAGGAAPGIGLGGKGGTQIAGGTGGTATNPNGTFGQGGTGNDGNATYPSGGGGGGWYGGGGGPGGTSTASSGGGGGSGYIDNILTNAITVRYTDPLFVANPTINGNGHVRITPIKVGGGHGNCKDTNSVALEEIVGINKIMLAGTPVTVKAQIRNVGIADLTTCQWRWTRNGTTMGTSTYTNTKGGLPEDFMDTINLGTYMPIVGQMDTIVVWVSLPNGKTDSITDDDTLDVISLGCGAPMSGTVTVGQGRNYTTLAAVFTSMKECGVGGNVILELKGTFNESIDLSDLSKLMDTYHLTITSDGNNPNNAIIQPPAGEYGIRLGKANNLTIKAITVDAATNLVDYAIWFADSCSNVLIRDCRLLHDTLSNETYYLVYKAETGRADKVSIVNNYMEGGYYGCFFLAGVSSSAYGNNIVLDSNVLINQYGDACLMAYTNFDSCSHNTIISRTSTESVWRGFSLQISNGPVFGNRIVYRGDASAYLLHLRYYYYGGYGGVPTTAYGLVSNNEIISYGTSVQYGIYAEEYIRANIFHNSVYCSEAAGTQYGMNTGANVDVSVKNNNVALMSAVTAYPIYQTSTTGFALTSDYNNLYAPTNIGYINNNAIKSIQAWQSAVPSDHNSVSVLPTFATPINDLKVTGNCSDFVCPSIVSVNRDIEGISRGTRTLMGCYDFTDNLNAALVSLTPLKKGGVAGQIEVLKVDVLNAGRTTINNINLQWSENSVNKAAVPYPVSLQPGDVVTLTLQPTLTYVTGALDVKVWINSVNSIRDDYQDDDTLSATTYICANSYSGIIKIGTGAGNDFNTIEDAYAAIDICGVSGDITFAFEKNTYNRSLEFLNTAARFGNYNIKVTSATGNANDVIFRPASDVVATLNNARNLTLEALTFDGRDANTYIVEFTGACTNIVMRNCKLLGDTTSTNSSYSLLYKANGTGVVNNFRMTGCLLDGGYCNANFYGGTAKALNDLASNIVWDSNTFKSAYLYAMQPHNTYFTSISYNTFLGRVNSDLPASQYMLYVYDGSHVEDIIGNHILQRDVTNYIYGIYLNAANIATVIPNRRPTMIVNNEIIGNTPSSNNYGIYLNGSGKSTDPAINVLHNSVYMAGAGSGRAIATASVPAGQMHIIKNNMLYVTGSATYPAYPIYLGTAFSTTLYDIDYNNMYTAGAPNNVGYIDGTPYNLISDWKTAVTTDLSSISLAPSFTNPNINLELSGYSGFNCPGVGIRTDINKKVRPAVVTMGAYERPPQGLDLMMWQVLPEERGVVKNQTITIKADVINAGANAITKATFGWKVNGSVKGTIAYNFPTPLNSYEQRAVTLGTLQATGNIGDHYDVVVWIIDVNGGADADRLNDTAKATYTIQLLAEYIPPFVADVITELSFDVHAYINGVSGATLTAPKMYIHTIVDGGYCSVYDTVTLVSTGNGNWVANIPPQYYNTTVVYSLHIKDTVGNNYLLKDTTYIKSEGGGGVGLPMDFTYTGSVQRTTLPKGKYILECWGGEGGTGGSAAGGKGGYSVGTIDLAAPTDLYIYVASRGYTGTTPSQTSGVFGGGGVVGPNYTGGQGAGASDIRIGADNLYARVIVAGGGGGSISSNAGGAGGGVTGIAGSPMGGQGGTQTAGGTGRGAGVWGAAGVYTGYSCGSGGGGWYGGGMGVTTASESGGGGSGWIYTATSYSTWSAANPSMVSQWQLNSLYYLTDASTIAGNQTFLSPSGVSGIGHSGDGFVRITPLGVKALYAGKHLSITEVVSPENSASTQCISSSTTDVEVTLENVGTADYQFSTDTINIMYEIVNPLGKVERGYIPIRTGSLLSGANRTLTLMSNLNITYSGNYSIKAWVNSPVDKFPCDDTIRYTYISGKITLPIDEDFTANEIPVKFMVITDCAAEWTPCHLDTNVMKPNHISKGSKDYGARAVKLEGVNGERATLSTHLLDLYGAVLPKLEVWYYHDTNTNPLDYSYTEVSIVVNGVAQSLDWLIKGDMQGKVHGWNLYTYPLDNYTNSQCVLIQFNGICSDFSGGTSVQYIDRVRISAYMNVAMKNVIIPKLQPCDFNNKEVKAVLYNPTSQYINFASSPTRINLNINNTQNIIVDKKTGGIAPMGYDTVTFSGINFALGTNYTFKAWILDRIDEDPGDDTTTNKASIFIDPDVAITLVPETKANIPADCLPIGFEVQQRDTVFNRSQTFDLFNIPIWVEVQNDNGSTVKYMYDTIPYIAKNSFVEHKFKDSYFVPAVSSGYYTVIANAVLACDYKTGNNENMQIQECADIHDIHVIEVLTPSDSNCDVRGDSVYLVVRLKNLDPYYPFSAVSVRAIISDGTNKQELQETIATLAADKPPVDYKFATAYIVPNADYTITAFVDKKDDNTANDTASADRCTKDDTKVPNFDNTGFTLGQNVPNPAKENTRIDYNVPQDGQVVFTVYTITGQALFVEKREATSGKNDIVFGTENLANGIYYYSMEYKGERLVKKMTIRK